MQWMMGAMKAIMSSDSIQKMTWMTNGSDLHKYLGSDIPAEYGGTGAPLKGSATTVKYSDLADVHGESTATTSDKMATQTYAAAVPVPAAHEPTTSTSATELDNTAAASSDTTAHEPGVVSAESSATVTATAPEITMSGPASKAADIA